MVIYPGDWEVKKLGDIGVVKMCHRIFQHQTKLVGEIPFYKIGTFGGKPDAYISRELYEKYKRLYPYPKVGDILISAAGTIGRVIMFDGKDSYFQDSNIVWLDVNRDVICNKFLMYFYESYPWRNLEGTTISRLYNSIILDTLIPLPPLKEQTAIAETLAAFDTHITNLTELITKKKAIRDGALDELMTGRTRLYGFCGDWEVVHFDDVIIPKARIGWQGLKKHEYLRFGYSYLISGTDFHNGTISLKDIWHVSRERYEMDKNIQVHEGDVLVTKDGTIGKVAIVPKLNKPATLNSHVYVFRTKDKLNAQFLYRVLQSNTFRKFIDNLQSGSIIVSLPQKDLKNFSFMLPPLDEQIAIADTLSVLDKEISSLETERAKISSIRDGAINDLLTGKVRLKIGI